MTASDECGPPSLEFAAAVWSDDQPTAKSDEPEQLHIASVP